MESLSENDREEFGSSQSASLFTGIQDSQAQDDAHSQPQDAQVDAHFLSHGGPFNLVSSEYGSSNEPSSTKLEATNGKGV